MRVLPPREIEPLILKMALESEKITNLLVTYFDKSWVEDQTIADIIQIICDYYSEYDTIPKSKTIGLEVTKFFQDLPDTKREACAKLISAKSIDLENYNIDHLEEQIIEYLKHNGLFQTLMSSLDEITARQQVVCFDRLEKIGAMSFYDEIGLDYFEMFEQHLQRISEPESRSSTGWDSLDEKTNGGFYSEGRCLITFVAETGMGKSLMLSNIASSYCKMGKFTVIISLEMSEDVYATRIDAHLSEISVRDIVENSDTMRATIADLKCNDPKLVIKEYPPESISCSEIRNYVDSLIRSVGRKPDIILIDYINLLLPTTGNANDNSYAKVGRVSRDLRALSYIFKCPVVSATQCNRDAYGSNDPNLDSISDSMGIAHVSDLICQLYQNDGDRNVGILNCKITKNRLGGIIGKSIPFHINYDNLIIADNIDDNATEQELENPEELIKELEKTGDL